MRYRSVASGIEAPSVAWSPLGWQPLSFSEIDPFCCTLLQTRYPAVPNLGDMTRYQEWNLDEPADVLIGGTPCQSFSVAGLRAGLDDPRGNLALVFLRLADRMRPRWIVWENVPGVLSSLSHPAPDPHIPSFPVDVERDGQEVETEDEYQSEELHAFNCFLAGLSDIGYGFAWRVLDAQYYGLAQRRARVFVVGYLGDWRPAAAVLFDPASVSWDSPPRRQTGKDVAGTLDARTEGGGFPGTDGATANHVIAATLSRGGDSGPNGGFAGRRREDDANIVPVLMASGAGTERPAGLATEAGYVVPSLRSGNNSNNSNPGTEADSLVPSRCLCAHQQRIDAESETFVPAMQAKNPTAIAGPIMQVRRLTPREAERLQGFPDDYTLVEHRGKPASDSARYRALGNSMPVPVIAWLGRRIAIIEAKE